jgi:hypothetical protein
MVVGSSLAVNLDDEFTNRVTILIAIIERCILAMK